MLFHLMTHHQLQQTQMCDVSSDVTAKKKHVQRIDGSVLVQAGMKRRQTTFSKLMKFHSVSLVTDVMLNLFDHKILHPLKPGH